MIEAEAASLMCFISFLIGFAMAIVTMLINK
jgi:hypothetical protein